MHARSTQLNIDIEDIRRLVAHPERDVRAALTQKVCREVRTLQLSEQEREVVTKILTFISNDAAAMVRRALAITLKNSPNLPREIAKRLIKDVDSIATPILSFSPVLTDDDLLEVLKSKAATKILAISRRERINGNLVKAILRYGDSRAVASVAANDGAELGAELGSQMLDLYHDNDLVKESYIARRDLPPMVVEKLLTMVSADLAHTLSEKHNVPAEIAVEIGKRTRERASVDLISKNWIGSELKALVARLAIEGRLTNSLIVRSACAGNISMVEHAFAEKSDVSLNKARLMIHDSGPFGLQVLCQQAGLSEQEFAILRAAITIYRDLEQKGSGYGREKFRRVMIERVLSLPVEFSDTDADYLFEKLDSIQI